MRQILYVSASTVPGGTADLASILRQARHNNARDGITGLLWSDGGSFLQVLEGPRAAVLTTFSRVLADPRHQSLIVLQERCIATVEFGGWTMAHRRASDAADAYDTQMQRLLASASDAVRTQFGILIATGHGAAPSRPVVVIGAPPPDVAQCETPPQRRVDRRIGAAFHNAGLALTSAFAGLPEGAPVQHDACIDRLCSIPRIATSDSQENRASR